MKSRIVKYIKLWEHRCYFSGIPDEVPKEINELCPSYKRIALAILKNDVTLKSLGFTPKVSQCYNQIKKAELIANGKIKYIQLTIFT